MKVPHFKMDREFHLKQKNRELKKFPVFAMGGIKSGAIVKSDNAVHKPQSTYPLTSTPQSPPPQRTKVHPTEEEVHPTKEEVRA